MSAQTFEQLHADHHHGIHAYLVGRTHDHALAEDLAQEVWLRVWRTLDRITYHKDGTRPWLFTIARHVLVDHWRKAGIRPQTVPLEQWTPARAYDPHQAALTRMDVVAALRRLQPALAAALLLMDGYGMGQPDTAALLGVPAGTVGSRCHRGRAAARRYLAGAR